MKRIPSLQYSFFAARSILRMRFAALPALHKTHAGMLFSDQEVPFDMDLLQLLRDTTQTRNDDETVARQEYTRRHSESDAGLPDYEEAQDRGWFRCIRHRVVPAVVLRDYYLRNDVPYAKELRDFVWWLTDVRYHIDKPGTHGSASTFEYYVADGETSGNKPPVQSPGWIAARLWDTGAPSDLVTWEMRWELLDRAPIVPAMVWSPSHAQRFREEAFQALRTSKLPEWKEIYMASGLRAVGDARETDTFEPPSDMLGRFLERTPSHYGTDLFESQDLCSLMGVLVLELSHIQTGPVPSSVAQDLAALAMLHPDLLDILVDCCLVAPQTLADFILCPETAALVCYLVATWNVRFQLNQEDRNAASDAVQTSMLEDCLEVFRHHLSNDTVSPIEYSRLLVALQEQDASRQESLPLLAIGLEHLQGLSSEIKLRIRNALVEMGCASASSPVFAVMLKAISVIGDPLSEDKAVLVANTYQRAFTLQERTDLRLLDTAGAGALAHIAFTHQSLRHSILYPLDVRIELVGRPNETVGLGLTIREHIRMLSRAIVGYPESVPDDLVTALAQAIQSGARDRSNKHQVDAFTFQLDFTIHGKQGPRLESDLINAINRLDNIEQQNRLVKELQKVEDPLVLGLLLHRVPEVHRESILSRLESLTPDEASPPAFVTQMQERIQNFLDAGLPDIAEMYLLDIEKKLHRRNGPELILQTLGLRLQLCYQRGDLIAIEKATIPESLPTERKTEAQRTLDFFRGLAFLKKEPPAAFQAAAIFHHLYHLHSLPAYAINLLAARIANLLGQNLFCSLSGKNAAQAKHALDEVDRAIPSLRELSDSSRAVHVPNCATVLLAIGRSSEALSRLQELAPAERTIASTVFEAVANARLGDHNRALALLRWGKERFGTTPLLTAAENHIEHSVPCEATPSILLNDEKAIQIRSTLKLFMELSPSEQAGVLIGPTPMALEKFLIMAFQDALAAFQRILSFLKITSSCQYDEDDYNEIVAALVEARLEGSLGWQAHGQSPGGYTAAGNTGRRDFVLRRRGVDITVFEALKSDRPNDKRISEHFHKLFGYSSTNIFFHVIYSFRKKISDMINAVEKVAKCPPKGTEYQGQRQIDADGARPGAIRGAYRHDGIDATVIFFVIDMLQCTQRQAVEAPQVHLDHAKIRHEQSK